MSCQRQYRSSLIHVVQASCSIATQMVNGGDAALTNGRLSSCSYMIIHRALGIKLKTDVASIWSYRLEP